MRLCKVHLLDTTLAFDKAYTYSVPDLFADNIEEGGLVVVPFGKSDRRQSAFVTQLYEGDAEGDIKSVVDLLDYGLSNPDEAAALAAFIGDRCFCTYGAAFKLMLPAGANVKSSVYYTALPYDTEDELYCFVRAREKAYQADILRSFGEEGVRLATVLCRKGALLRHSEVAEKSNIKTELWVEVTPPFGEVKGSKQNLLLSVLADGDKSMAYLKEAGVSPATVRTMEGKGYVSIYEKRVLRFAYTAKDYTKKAYTLSEQQREVRDSVVSYMQSGKAEACLLYGVTGNGKTKIILEAVNEALRQNRTAIVLIPEIGLTSQAIATYYAEYGDRCAVIHSRLSAGERADTYDRIARGEVSVVIGTRSAVFAPLKDIGLIVMDEEQEHTYKSEKTPKYHARDIARFRCARHGALMLLASATPSVESFYRAKSGVYHLLTLDSRFGGTELPQVEIEDIVGDREIEKGRLIGGKLKAALAETLEKGEQAILFLGRRGYNSALRCRSCGYVFTCPRCSVSLNYHAYSSEASRRGKLICHYCGHIEDKPVKCPECGGGHIGYFGYGTQLLQDELDSLFGEGRALRMDTDTTTAKRSHDEILSEFAAGEADILYGTQMVVKGLDFPRVSLVGLVMADSVLYMNDYRAPERMFSLITQLVGRAGRSGKRGRAIVQTYNPMHQTLRLGAKQDYVAFYESEIRLRRSVVFPPFCDIAVFGFSATTEETALGTAKDFSALLESGIKENEDLKLMKMGPYKEGIYKIGGRYRCKIIVKYKDSKVCRAFFRGLMCSFKAPKKDRASFDIDINPAII